MNTSKFMIPSIEQFRQKFIRMINKYLKKQYFAMAKNALMLFAIMLNVFIAPYAHAIEANALPNGGVVVGGNASFDYTTPNELHIQQNTDRAIINWNSFNIGSNATTQFHQPSSTSLVVNKVAGSQDPTRILGTLKSNGTVIVLDTNGVIFGRDSIIDVGGIVASTGNLNNSEVMGGAGSLTLTDVGNGGSIINEGSITVKDAGIAAFVAPSVSNSGLIQAKLGRVSLAAGDKATVDLYGDKLVELALDSSIDHASITNSGTIDAEGGTVLITAAAARNVVDNAINMSGIVKTSSVTQKGGKIIIEGGNINVSGTLDASGKNGGGEILIGGDYKGSGSVKHAQKTVIAKEAVIKANATDSGKGGKIVIWSDKNTQAAGTIEAKGVDQGGFIETSSAEKLTVDGETIINVSASMGNGGDWLIDPQDILIGNTWGDIQAGTINAALNGGSNVTITTNSATAGGGDITLDYANITKSVTNNDVTLRLEANRNINSNGSTIRSTSGNKLNVIFQADRLGNLDGSIDIFNTNISTNGGNVVFGGGPDLLTGFAYGNLTGAKTGISYGNGTINAGSGNITMRGHGYNDSTVGNHGGISIDSSSILKTSGAGTINLYGIGGTATSFAIGTEVSHGSSIETDNGNIAIYGQSGTTNIASGAIGVSIFSSSSIKSNTGNIDITAIAGHAGMQDLYINTGSNIIGGATMTGNMTFNINSADIAALNASTTNSILIKPRTSSRNIILGQTGAAGNLVLTDAALGFFNAGTLTIGDALNGSGNVSINTWDLSGKSHDVNIHGGLITTDGMILGSGDVTLHGQNIGIVSGTIAKNTSNNDVTLSLLAKDNILMFDANILNTSNNKLNVLMNADRTNTHSGAVRLLNTHIETKGGHVIAGGGNGNIGGTDGILGNGDGTGADDVDAWGNGQIISGFAFTAGVELENSTVITQGGDIILNGHGSTQMYQRGVGLYTAELSSGTGNISLRGTSGTGISDISGIMVQGAIIEASSGSIDIKGIANGPGDGTSDDFDTGLYLSGATIRTTSSLAGKGNITIIGDASTSSGDTASGIAFNTHATISSVAGNIRLEGKSANDGHSIRTWRDVFITSTLGDITIDTSGSSNTGSLDFRGNAGDSFILGHAGTKKLTIITDDFHMDTSTLTGNGSGFFGDTILLNTSTQNRSIGLGSTTGDLLWDADVLDLVSAGTNFVIGDGSNDISIDGWDLSTKSHNVYVSGNDVILKNITIGTGNVSLLALGGGDIFLSKDSTSNANGSLNLLSTGHVNISKKFLNTGTGTINVFAGWDGASGLNASYTPDIGAISFGATAKNITLGADSQLQSNASGTAILAATKGIFTNSSAAAANALSTPAGRYLVYSASETAQTKGGLNAPNIYAKTYNSQPPLSVIGSSHFIFMQSAPVVAPQTPAVPKHDPTIKQAQDSTQTPKNAESEHKKTSDPAKSGCIALMSTSGHCFISL